MPNRYHSVARSWADMMMFLGLVPKPEVPTKPAAKTREVLNVGLGRAVDVRERICRKCGKIFIPPAKRGRPPTKCKECKNG